jgi:hypothetical protein
MGKQVGYHKKRHMNMNKQLLLIILVAITVPPLLWIVHLYSKPLPKVTDIDRIAGPALEYSSDRMARKTFIQDQHYQLATSDDDAIIRLRQRSNPLYASGDVNIRYDKDLDLIVAEVTTIRIEPAKREALTWLTSQGISTEAICVLPVTFTINEPSSQALKGLGIRFDPLPTECK